MKTKRIIVVGVPVMLALLAAAYVVFMAPNVRHQAEWQRTVSALRRLSRERVDAATRAFARDHETAEGDMPLSDLVLGGYLRAEDIRGLEGRDAVVSFPDDRTRPQMIWIRVRASDGAELVLLGDGSIQKINEIRVNVSK